MFFITRYNLKIVISILNTSLKRTCTEKTSAYIQNLFSVSDSQYKRKHIFFYQKSQIYGLFKKVQHFDNQIVIFAVLCNSKWGQTNKLNLVSSVTITILGDFCEFVILRKMLGENANKIYQVYKGMDVLHIFNRILGIPLPGYLGNKNHILILIKV